MRVMRARDGTGSAASAGVAAFDPDDLDSLHTLPLSIIPLETPGLRRLRMIKNARLDGVVELYRGTTTGSAQVAPAELDGFYQDIDGALGRDTLMLAGLSRLSSYDVYSLRVELRRLEIGFSDYDVLSLSAAKRAELTEFMKTFTRPLIARVFGGEAQIDDVSQIIAMLAHPDRAEAMKKLQILAAELDIEVSEVPSFLEDYGDIFVSLSYFRRCLDEIMEIVPAFLEWLNEMTSFYQVTSDPSQKRQLVEIDQTLNEISTSVVGRFEFFDRRSRDFWRDINAASFREFRNLVTAHHVSIGAVLCGLAVKMNLWEARFPGRAGGPVKRLEFINSEIRQGLARIRDIENQAADKI